MTMRMTIPTTVIARPRPMAPRNPPIRFQSRLPGGVVRMPMMMNSPHRTTRWTSSDMSFSVRLDRSR